ncbi:MAG: YceI family protein [Sphingomonadaceae bacterium]
MKARRATAALLLGLVSAGPAAAQRWVVDPARSSIAFESAQAGTPVRGRFGKWTADIRFDPARLAEARVVVIVDLASATTGDRNVDGQLPTGDWFNIAAGAQARFVSSAITAAGPGRYVARGTLAMKGVSVPVELPFSLSITGNSAVMQGQTQLDRRALRIGMASDASAAWVPFAVPVSIQVTARRAP